MKGSIKPNGYIKKQGKLLGKIFHKVSHFFLRKKLYKNIVNIVI